MADQLATPTDLTNLIPGSSIPAATATLLLECATAVVQSAAGGQRIFQVVGDVHDLTGDTDSWLSLPQIPVTAVTSVVLDGVTLTAGSAGSGGSTYRLRGSRLWRGDGWQTYCGEPSDVMVTCTHGYAAGAQELQLARSATLGLCRPFVDNETGAVSVRIDDYAATFDAMSARMDASPHLAGALRRAYGHRAGTVRAG